MTRSPSYRELMKENARLKRQNTRLASEAEISRNNLASVLAKLSRDELTGILNEQGFLEHLEHPVADLKRHPDQSLYLAYADINQFKTVNDNFGHKQGDLAIVHMAKILSTSTRGIDIVARLHGDEFAIALPDTTRAGADAVLQRIHTAIAAAPFCAAGQQVTLSLAIAAIRYDPAKSPTQNLHDADQAMLAQKTHRRR